MGVRDHKEEIIRWLNAPDDTKVWYKGDELGVWVVLCDDPSWLGDGVYIVDNKHAEIRKQFVDDRSKVEYKHSIKGWTPTIIEDLLYFSKGIEDESKEYRIKPEEPVYEWQWLSCDTTTGKWTITDDYYRHQPKMQSRCNASWRKYEPSKRRIR